MYFALVYLWRIHVDIWQNQYNIVKLKNKIKFKKKEKEKIKRSKKNGVELLLLKWAWHRDFQQTQYGKGGKCKATIEKPDKHYLSQVIKISINNDKLCWSYH